MAQRHYGYVIGKSSIQMCMVYDEVREPHAALLNTERPEILFVES